MLYYDRIDVFEGIDINKKNKPKESDFVIIVIFQIKGLSSNQMYKRISIKYKRCVKKYNIW